MYCGATASQPPVQEDVANIWRPVLSDPGSGFGSKEDIQAQAWFLPCFLELIKLGKEYVRLLPQSISEQGREAALVFAGRLVSYLHPELTLVSVLSAVVVGMVMVVQINISMKE